MLFYTDKTTKNLIRVRWKPIVDAFIVNFLPEMKLNKRAIINRNN
jgi:hypothetical protein